MSRKTRTHTVMEKLSIFGITEEILLDISDNDGDILVDMMNGGATGDVLRRHCQVCRTTIREDAELATLGWMTQEQRDTLLQEREDRKMNGTSWEKNRMEKLADEYQDTTTDGYPINQGTHPEENIMTGAVGEDGRVREKVAYDTTETRLVHTSGPLVGYEVNYPEDGDLSADQRAQIYTDSKFPPDYLTEEEVAELTNMEHAARVFQCMVIYNHLEDTSSGRVMPVADEDHTAVELDAHLKECASCSTMMDRMNEVTEAVPDVVTPV